MIDKNWMSDYFSSLFDHSEFTIKLKFLLIQIHIDQTSQVRIENLCPKIDRETSFIVNQLNRKWNLRQEIHFEEERFR